MAAASRLLRPSLNPGELIRAVRYVLLPPALVLDGTECPDVMVLAHGRIYGLILRQPVGVLSAWQRAHIPPLRAAGMQVTVIDTIGEAVDALDTFGLPLRAVGLGSGHDRE